MTTKHDTDPLDIITEAIDDWRETLNLDDPYFDDKDLQRERQQQYDRVVVALNDLRPLKDVRGPTLTAIIPDPNYVDGSKRKEVHGDTPSELCKAVREFINVSGYGASEIGALFNVFRDGNIVATVRYNGLFDWRDPLYDPANHKEI